MPARNRRADDGGTEGLQFLISFEVANCDLKRKGGVEGEDMKRSALPNRAFAMLSSVLNSERAVQVNIYIIRVFTRLRQLLASHKELRDKVEEHDKQLSGSC